MHGTEDFLDVLQETLNIGIGRAAASLSEMIGPGTEIDLTVPRVSILSADDALPAFNFNIEDQVACVKQGFAGPLKGSAFLLYPEEESQQLVQLVLGSTDGSEQSQELEQSTLCEVGNIILNAALASLANLLVSELETSVPKLLSGNWKDVFSKHMNVSAKRDDSMGMFLYMDVSFKVKQNERLVGLLGFAMDVSSAESLASAVNRLLEQFSETK